MTERSMVLFFDVDNTLLDNDAVYRGLRDRILASVGEGAADRFWDIFQRVRESEGVVDFPGSISRFESEDPDGKAAGRLREEVFAFPFSKVVYPQSPGAVAHASRLGLPVILSDGDATFQPYKIRASGLAALFDERVLVRRHKDREFDAVRRIYPADHYVMVDDKPRIHRSLKERYGPQITTVMVCQGHYAAEDHDYHGADLVIESIGEIEELSAADIRERAIAGPPGEAGQRRA